MSGCATQEWWTSPAEGDGGGLIMVTGRKDVEKFRAKSKYVFRVDVSYDYSNESLPDGMPDDKAAEMLEKITDRFHTMCDKEKGVVMTGIFTGEKLRDWIFYTVSLKVFQRSFNKTLEDLGDNAIPFEFRAEEDAEWQAYDEMRNLAEIES